jgi:hypothetical protein
MPTRMGPPVQAIRGASLRLHFDDTGFGNSIVSLLHLGITDGCSQACRTSLDMVEDRTEAADPSDALP